MHHPPRRATFLLVPALALAVAGFAAGTAHAAVTGTLNPAVVDGSDFTWTCDINPGGATIYVAGRSWYDPSRPDFPALDTPRQQVSGAVTLRLSFSRVGDPQTRYGYRCVWFSSPTSTTLLGRTSNSLTVTTGSDTMFGSNVDGSTRVPCTKGSSGCTCDNNGLNCTRDETFTEALTRQDAAYAPRILRIFWDGLPSTSCSHVKNSLTRPSVQSWKGDPGQLSTGAYSATLNAWFSCFNRPTRVSFYHEPEDNFTTTTQKTAYRAAWVAFVNLAEAHPNRENLIPTLILADYDFVSGRNWKDWYTPRVHEIWWDLYNFKEENSSGTDDELMAAHQALRPSLAVTRAEGKPYGIAELGYDKLSNRPAFLTDAAAWARANNIAGFTYFDAIGGLGDHRLLDSASKTAWRAICAG